MTQNEFGVTVGEFFVCSWGYDQTNIDFYKVVGVTAKQIKIQQWSSKRTEDQHLVPGDGPLVRTHYAYDGVTDYDSHARREVRTEAKTTSKKVHRSSFGPAVSLTTYSFAHRWDGKPESDTYTHGGAGH